MKKLIALSLLATSAVALAACSSNTADNLNSRPSRGVMVQSADEKQNETGTKQYDEKAREVGLMAE